MEQHVDLEELLRRKFPEMKPVKGTPALFSLNGFGLGMVGRRDVDAETGTYVKSHCVTALFVPIFTLGAYRVADAENGGQYILGKERASSFAKACNALVVLGIAAVAGLSWFRSHTNSPAYKAKERLELAADHSGAGHDLAAASVYKSMILDGLPSKAKAQSGLQESITKALASDAPETVVEAIVFADATPETYFGDTGFLSEIGSVIDGSAQRFAKDDPAAALLVLTASAQLPVPPDSLPAKRQALLETLVSTDPANSEFAISLAGLYEESDRVDEAYGLLEPHIEKLGTGEGSRILGQILLVKGQPAEAVPLLERYIEPRLKDWREASERYQQSAENAYQAVIQELENNKGPASFYTAYDAASSDEARAGMVDEYVYERMQRDTEYLAAGRLYEEAGAIVPVIMDLGISQLQAAQSSTDPSARKELLGKAEEQFLSLKDETGESDEFKFLLGQVYYWSGRQDEGHALFDDILAASGRDFQTLALLSTTLREIGNEVEARALTEEAYGKAASTEDKNLSAGLRANLYIDIDDQIEWLEKVEGGGLRQTTQLAWARAQKAVADGETEEAIKQLRISEDGWAKLPVSSSSLNNGALVQFELFTVTGDIAFHQRGSSMMERAVALSPDSSILLGNAASSLVTTAVMQVVEGKLSSRAIQDGVGFETLRFLYHDDPSRDLLSEALLANENFGRATELLERAILLSPNSMSLYGLAFALYGFVQDYDALERVSRQAGTAKFDHSVEVAQYEEFARGEADADAVDGRASGLKHLQELLDAATEPTERLRIKIRMSESRMSLFNIGKAADLVEEVAFLREAHAQAPSTRSSHALVTALAQQACLELAAGNTAFRTLLKDCRRESEPKTILVLALTSEALRPLVLGNAEAMAALGEDLRQDELFPSNRGGDSVIIAAAMAPDRLGEARRLFAAARLYPIAERMAELMTPWDPSNQIRRYMRLVAEEKPAEAKALLQKARADGLRVPAL